MLISNRCQFCGKEHAIDITEEQYAQVIGGVDLIAVKPALSAFEREFFITGMCDNCQEKTFNIPTKEHESEWGKFVKYCDCCDCRLYEKDIKRGRCPSCYSEVV